MSLNSLTANASSYSSNYSLQDEALDFSHNSDQLKSSSYTMDLSTIFWTNRIGESASYSVVDSNSGESQSVTPPSTASGGSTSVIAGGRRDINLGESDTADLIALEDIEIEDNRLTLRSAPETEEDPAEIAYVVTSPEVEEILKKEHRGDIDACSPSFEWTFLKTSTLENDSDGDGLYDCDEALLYGLNPLKYDESYERVGLTLPFKIVYLQNKPLLIGRGDFNLVDVYSENLIQIGLQMEENATDLGLFFMKLDKNLNFAETLPVELFDGTFKTTLYRDGNKQSESDYITIDHTAEFVPVNITIPDNGALDTRNNIVLLSGNAGPNYGVVAIWKGDNYIDVSADVSNSNGDFEFAAPIPFIDGSYEVIVYALVKENDYYIQTNYQKLGFNFKEGQAFILPNTAEKAAPLWKAGIQFVDKGLRGVNYVEIHDRSRESSFMYLVSYLIFLIFVSLTFYALWSKSRSSKYS